MATDLTPATESRGIATIDTEAAASAVEHILATGDLSKLSAQQRVGYYLYLCEKLGISSESRPFDWLMLDGRLVFYPNKSCAEQLRRNHQISIELTRRERIGDLFVVEVKGWRPNGQQDFASKYVSIKDARGNLLGGRDLSNAYAKAETGAKRRLTLSMVGLASVPDVEDLKGARIVTVDPQGNVIAAPTDEERYLAEQPRAARAMNLPTFESEATAEDAPVSGGISQAPRPEELETPRRTGPRPTLKRTKESIDRLCAAWFGAVSGSSLADDDARHRYVAQWTASEGWPKNKQTESIRDFFARATDREAEDFLAHVRALVEDERKANEEALAEARRQTGDQSEEPF